MEKWALFAFGAALAWGTYGPALQIGAEKLAEPPGAAHGYKPTESEKASGRMKALLGVGIAYFLLAVLAPILILLASGDSPGPAPSALALTVASGAGALAGLGLLMAQNYGSGGTAASIVAGSLGAIGAVFVIFALSSGGKPTYVMPLVFGLAPVINVATTFAIDKYSGKDWPMPATPFFLGILMAGAGAGLVLMYKPMAKPTGAGGHETKPAGAPHSPAAAAAAR
jgi:hypothetical protein